MQNDPNLNPRKPDLGSTEPKDSNLPPKPEVSMQEITLKIAPGIEATFKLPSDWQPFSIPECTFEFGAWQSPDGVSTLIPSSEVFNSIAIRNAQLSDGIRRMTSAGNEVPVVVAAPVVFEDGTSAISINFPVNYIDGTKGFEYSHVVQTTDRWVRLAIIAAAETLDIPKLIKAYHPITSSIRLKEV